MDPIEDIEDALRIGAPSSAHLKVEDCRRLTGPGLLWDRPGAVVQITSDMDPDDIAAAWTTQARRVLAAVGWGDEHLTARAFDGGINLALSAPMDQLYSAVFVAETAWHLSACALLGKQPDDFTAMIADLTAVMAREANPPLIALLNEGARRGVDVLCDDDEVSVGHGVGSQTWPVGVLPAPDNVDWDRLHNAPVALITGTNGKTTTTRLLAAIGKAAGKVSGLTSTDFVRVGDDVLDRGDYSGPGGARLLLRDQRLEIACLEVARGGILRRGLPTRSARAAIVTNVAADHLGQYGVNTVPELARAKFAVHRALAPDGALILNADDPYVVAEAAQTKARICWFSLDPGNAQIATAGAAHQPCAWADKGEILYFDGSDITPVIAIADIPITLGGAAQYNVSNALAATCAARALGLSDAAIRKGLSGFHNDPTDNPGRFNEFAVNGARLFVDFAHNPHSVAAVADTLSAIPARRRMILLSHAGDRSDDDIRDVTQTALSLGPDVLVACELLEYLRGRDVGAVPGLIRETCRANGMRPDQILSADSPLAGVRRILALLQPGDVALLLVLAERDAVFDLLAQQSGHTP
jgi:UDP-N-acetylmuramyl tripeptide synthase